MVQVIKTAILAAFLSTALLAAPPQGKSPPELDALPTCDATYEQQVRVFTLGDSSTDCDIIGGGSTLVRCVCDNGTWIVDAGTHDNLDRINFNVSATPEAHTPGNLYWCDAGENTLCFDRPTAGNTVQIGQELYMPHAVNKEGSTISNGEAVYISGAVGQSVEVKLARADVISTSAAIGLATHDILNNQNGAITTFGAVHGLDTSGLSVGAVYLSTTVAGGLTNTVPTGPDSTIFMGFVINSHPTDGEIVVNPGVDFSESITLLSAYLTGSVTVEDGLAVNSDSDATGDFSVQGDTVADILKCLVSTDTCTYKGTELGGGGGVGTTLNTEIPYSNAGTFDGSPFTFDGTDITLGSGQMFYPAGTAGTPSIVTDDFTVKSSGIVWTPVSTTSKLGFTYNGVLKAQISNQGIEIVDNGTTAQPALSIFAFDNGLSSAGTFLNVSESGRLIAGFSSALTPTAGAVNALRTATDTQLHVSCQATQSDNCFEVDPDGDGTLTDGGMSVEADGDINHYGLIVDHVNSSSPSTIVRDGTDSFIRLWSTTNDSLLTFDNSDDFIVAYAANYLGGITTADQYMMVFDGPSNVYLGAKIEGSPVGLTFGATGGSGTDIAAADLTLAGGQGTGTGLGGDFIVQTAMAGTTGSSLNALSTALLVDAETQSLTVTGPIQANAGALFNDTATTACIDIVSGTAQLFHDTNCDGVKDGGEEYIDSAGGGGGISAGDTVVMPDATTPALIFRGDAAASVNIIEVESSAALDYLVVEPGGYVVPGADCVAKDCVAIGEDAPSVDDSVNVGFTAGHVDSQFAVNIGNLTGFVTEGDYSVNIGNGAGNRATGTLISASSINIGASTDCRYGSICIGANADADSTFQWSIVLGSNSNSPASEQILLGNWIVDAGLAGNHAFIVGSNWGAGNEHTRIDNMFLGGYEDVVPNDRTLYLGPAGDGTDVTAADGIIVAPRGTGTGIGGDFIVKTAIAGTTGPTPNTPTTALLVDAESQSLTVTGLVYPGQYATGSLPTCDGATAGATAYDTTTNKHVGCNGTIWNDMY